MVGNLVDVMSPSVRMLYGNIVNTFLSSKEKVTDGISAGNQNGLQEAERLDKLSRVLCGEHREFRPKPRIHVAVASHRLRAGNGHRWAQDWDHGGA